MHFFCNLTGIFFNRLYILFADVYGRNDTCRVTGMNTGKLNMLHHCRNKGVCSITDGIGFTL